MYPSSPASKVKLTVERVHSSRGINEFLGGEVRFLSLARWIREYECYNTLRHRIAFFRQFRVAKTFLTWKSLVRRQKFVKTTRQLTVGASRERTI